MYRKQNPHDFRGAPPASERRLKYPEPAASTQRYERRPSRIVMLGAHPNFTGEFVAQNAYRHVKPSSGFVCTGNRNLQMSRIPIKSLRLVPKPGTDIEDLLFAFVCYCTRESISHILNVEKITSNASVAPNLNCFTT